MKKTPVETLLVKAELTGLPEKRLLKSRNLGAVDLVWPRTGIARRTRRMKEEVVAAAKGAYRRLCDMQTTAA